MNEREDITKYGECRCCFALGNHRDLMKEYKWNGTREVYFKIFLECFNVFLCTSTNKSNLICTPCVLRLRDAASFKKMVMDAEQTLNSCELKKNGSVIDLIDPSSSVLDMELKGEPELNSESSDAEQNAGISDEDSIPEQEKPDIPSNSQGSTPERCNRKYPPRVLKRRRNKTYKQYTKNDLYEAVQSVLCGEMECADAAQLCGIRKSTLQTEINKSVKETKEDEDKGSKDENHYKLIEDIQTLLKYTNAIPFRTKAMRYYCFYCSSDAPFFEDPEELRSHTQTDHSKEKIYSIKLLMRPQPMNEVIKLDVNDLHCTACRTQLPDWNEMFVHFAETHSVGFSEAYTKIIPYALTSNLNCVLCHESFHNFGYLDAHMNEHYSNYICYECGDTFLAANRLDKHLTVHKVGSYPCKLCSKEFKLERYLAKHNALVHRQERKCKCLYCDEKFVDQFNRHKHVTEAHKDKVQTITCEVCGKVFTWKSYYVAHMRKRHRGEKKHKCQYCPKVFQKRHELKSHLETHSDIKNFVCLCGETFKRASNLRKHVQLEHGEDNMIIGDRIS